MKKRALLTLEFMPKFGGIERLLHERARNFRPEDTFVLSPHYPGDEEFDQKQRYHVIRTPTSSNPIILRILQFFGPLFGFIKLRKKYDIQEIECGQAFPFPIFCRIARKIWKTPYIVWVHGNDFLKPLMIPVLGKIVLSSLKNADRIMANSRFVSRLLVDAGIPEEKIRIHSQIIDTDIFYPAEPSPDLRKRYGLQDHAVILSIGRLVERKGFDSVIRCLPALVQKHKLKYVIVGSGPHEEYLRQIVQELRMDDYVVFAGGVDDAELPKHYHLANIFVMVSKFLQTKGSVEGLGLVYLEASASRVPVVAGKSGGVPDVVHHEKNGLLVDPNNLDEIQKSLDRILSDQEFAKSLGEYGYQLATQPANWGKLSLD